MPDVPTPIKIALGLAAAAAEEVRKLPETLPSAATNVPMTAVATAMQASLRVQQHLASLAARGEEVLAQLRGTSDEPPSWATFDDAPSEDSAVDAASPMRAAFDRIDYDATGYSDDEDEHGRWDAVGSGYDGIPDVPGRNEEPSDLSRITLDDVSEDLGLSPSDSDRVTPVGQGGTRAPSASKAPAAKKAPAKEASATKAPAKKAPAKKASATKAPAKKASAKAPAKKSAAKSAAKAPAKKAPAKAPAKKAPATKASAASAPSPTKAPARKAAARKSPAKKTSAAKAVPQPPVRNLAATSLAEDLAAALVADPVESSDA